MRVFTDAQAMTAWAVAQRSAGRSIGLVPTMGYLHRGHGSLMDIARQRCSDTIVSIYVNPLQFGPNEDLDRYPRDRDGDLELCRQHGVGAVFLPRTLYEDGFATQVTVAGLSEGLCGAARPTHFAGVTTVVARLFGITRPHLAVFGEKDYQQLAVIRCMTRDLAMGIEIVGGALIRDDDGLAMSSRNRYLSADDRKRALSLHRSLLAMQRSPATEIATLLQVGLGVLDADRLDYLEVVDADTLEPLSQLDRPARALVAAQVGSTRLIDNLALGPR